MGFASGDNEVIKESFRRFKEHMLALEHELKANREFLIKLNDRVETIEKRSSDPFVQDNKKEDLEGKKEPVNKNNSFKAEFEEIDEISPPKPSVILSGVASPQERKGFLATPLRHRSDTSTPFRQPGTDSGTHFDKLDIEKIKSDLNKVFFSLTNREFKVFMAIYSLEEQHNSSITYLELAKHLDISASSIRDYVSELSRKGTPINKEKSRNGIVYISVLPEFRALNLISKLIAFRNTFSDQKSIFDKFE